ncbi:secreted protein : Uncharacterized protein OS=Singulisphaera acidiphila (strain ATCC BAA-1392 / DSM 18658 / VKM B-2454 / MOB10) GN=Sinac_0893 PE=4 SV=1 [Gemmataceae bacterium]|nr:secreted protein : Uncharacterized protein OS=Singulisphaera acidiphila (strain ATCC BAA-1392 / DSM 18658 / VKM B-2454 / MOB10) GN=Sinac_0893 PE=4 SV=1 [Gemmataceae bacterium]VTU02542.1 secreted protein : Uncharacterized protein OS=Singulisphaera acidiphila (strain ATCC BAA-1392 / DSM 18658 / VKM B-2454 / MOB10) GN=Sinac_0893 PE=4 SV=1 [Gemmataceae bacterium]
MPRDDGDEVEGRPVRPQKRKKKRKAPPRSVPVWAWVAVGIGALTLVVIGLVLVTRKGDRPTEPVARGDVRPVPEGSVGPGPGQPPVTVPPKTEPPKPVPPKVTPPKSEPPKLDPQGPAAEIDADWPVLPPRKRRNEATDTPNRTTVRWYPPVAGGGPLMVLDVPTEPYPPRPGPHRGLLARELARQALSMAAREEFGAGTRDAVLGEPPGDLTGRAPTRTFELAWLVFAGRSARATLSVADGAATRVAWELDVPLAGAPVLDYAALATALEAAARGPLADALAKETNAARVPVRVSDAKTPVDVEAGLKAVNYFELFRAVRTLHAAVRSGGESPALLTDLARGYATLGLLTEHLSVVSHKSFTARGLLYANRAVARKAPAGPWAVAYASCLAGLHQQALDQAKAAGGTPPPWARVIEPACRFDHVALRALPGDEVGPLAGVLRYLATQDKLARELSMSIGADVLRSDRDCFRVSGQMCVNAGELARTALTAESPRALSVALADRLAKFPELPPGATGVLAKVRGHDAAAQRALLRALEGVEKPGEPSLGCLATLVRAERYAHLGQRLLLYQRETRNAPALAEAAVREALPFLEDSPIRNLVATRLEPTAGGAARAAAQLPTSEVQVGGWGHWLNADRVVYDFDTGTALELAHADDTHGGLFDRPEANGPAAHIENHLKVSPHSPFVRVAMIHAIWDKVAGEAPAWEKEFAAHPLVLAELARKYLKVGRHDDAERAARAAVALSPDYRSYLVLMDLYREVRKDDAKLLAIMEDRLTRGGDRLEVAAMRVDIARFYGQRKDPATALKYAERAAEDTGAQWALSAAIAYSKQVGDKAKIALWHQRYQDRYGPLVGPGVVP